MVLNVVQFAFMRMVLSFRKFEDLYSKHMWLMDNKTPSFMVFQRFIANHDNSIEDIFHDLYK